MSALLKSHFRNLRRTLDVRGIEQPDVNRVTQNNVEFGAINTLALKLGLKVSTNILKIALDGVAKIGKNSSKRAGSGAQTTATATAHLINNGVTPILLNVELSKQTNGRAAKERKALIRLKKSLFYLNGKNGNVRIVENPLKMATTAITLFPLQEAEETIFVTSSYFVSHATVESMRKTRLIGLEKTDACYNHIISKAVAKARP